MERSETLLERLARSAGGARSLAADRQAVLRSIVANLQDILNTRRGSAPAQMDLGMPSPHELMQRFPDGLAEAEQAIRCCIQDYEPRLRNVVVQCLERDDERQEIRFRIAARLTGAGDDPVSFRTDLTPDGRLQVR